MATTSSSSAYIDADLRIAGRKDGILSGLTFAVKDMYNVKGQKIGFGNPTWRETHPAATEHSVAVQALLDAGAELRGRTHMDELAYSLNGENVHYGTPQNPVCPDRIPGGSSSGSAVATASGDVDFALGSDTGGSVRVPASYCGVLGMRPTHDAVSLEGACPLAPSFDTCGWFARDPEILKKVGQVLLRASRPSSPQFKFTRLLVGEDAFGLADKEAAMSLFKAVEPHKELLEGAFGQMQEISVLDGAADGIAKFKDWFHAFRIIQAGEAWKALGGWITKASPQFGHGTKERFEAAARMQPEQVAEMEGKRDAIIGHIDALLGDNGLLILPAAPGPAPRLQTPVAQLDGYRTRLISLTCIAGLAKLPQITIPCATVEGCPMGLGVVGPRGSDEALLDAASLIFSHLNRNAQSQTSL